jgi:hypothetical protein
LADAAAVDRGWWSGKLIGEEDELEEIFLHFSFLFFAKIYGPKKMQNKHLAPRGTAAGTYRRAPRL